MLFSFFLAIDAQNIIRHIRHSPEIFLNFSIDPTPKYIPILNLKLKKDPRVAMRGCYM